MGSGRDPLSHQVEGVVQAEPLGEQQAEGVLVRLDEAEVGAEAQAQALLVALGQGEGALQRGGELAELSLQQRCVQRVLGREVLVEHWLGDAGRLGDGLHGGTAVAVPGEDPAGHVQQLRAARGRRQTGTGTHRAVQRLTPP
jgi:hypothetical protein